MVGPAFLLDVNVLLALWMPTQQDHQKVIAWFQAEGNRHWATCPITQAGFVRLASNPALTPDALSPDEAVKVLSANLRLPGHVFWADDLDVPSSLALCGTRLQRHRQITDAYLLGLALHHRAHLVTLDSAIASLLPNADRSPTRVIGLLNKVPRK